MQALVLVLVVLATPALAVETITGGRSGTIRVRLSPIHPAALLAEPPAIHAVGIRTGRDHVETTACQFSEFVQLDDSERRRAILTCSPEQKISLYLSWSRYTRPSNFDYLEEVASSGAALLPEVIARLLAPGLVHEINKPELLVVLDEMQQRGYYRVNQDKELMAILRTRIAQMKEPLLKEWAVEILSGIETATPR